MTTALITGASGGIGGAIARALAAKGINIMLGCNSGRVEAEQLQNWIHKNTSAKAAVFSADISREDEVESMFRACNDFAGGADILVNNAAVSHRGLLTDTSPGEWDRVFDVNVRGAYLCCRAALPHMLKKRRGSIINISSMWGVAGASCEVAYSASKAALIGLTKALAKEVGPSGVRVNCVAPGYIDTAMNDGFDKTEINEIIDGTPLRRAGVPHDVAQAVLFLAGDGADFITGQVLSPNGGAVI